MLKLIRLILFVLGLIIVVALAIANRQLVEVSLLPVPFSFTAPLFAVFLAGLVMGVVLGGLAYWLSNWRARRVAHRDRRRLVSIEARQQLLKEQEELAEAERSRRRQEQLALGAPAR